MQFPLNPPLWSKRETTMNDKLLGLLLNRKLHTSLLVCLETSAVCYVVGGWGVRSRVRADVRAAEVIWHVLTEVSHGNVSGEFLTFSTVGDTSQTGSARLIVPISILVNLECFCATSAFIVVVQFFYLLANSLFFDL